jgi:hypothetical protein
MLQLFKIQIRNIKMYYETKELFEKSWKASIKYSKIDDVIAFTIDWKERDWKCIRRIGPNISYYNE